MKKIIVGWMLLSIPLVLLAAVCAYSAGFTISVLVLWSVILIGTAVVFGVHLICD